MAHHGGSTSSSGSGWNKVLKDFILGGTSGAIAKTIAAPIERVKLLLQTQENNPKLAARPYKGTPMTIQVLWTVLFVACKKRVLFLSGEATGPMYCDTSPPKLSTSPLRMPSIASSSRVLTLRLIVLSTLPCLFYLVVLPVASVSFLSILLISQGLVWVLISENQPMRDSSTDFSIAARKSLQRTAFKDYTKDLVYPSWESSPTAPSISGTNHST